MNSTDLQALLATSAVSRAAFFAQLLAEPDLHPHNETPSDDLPTDRLAPLADTAQPAGAGFPA